MALFAGFSVPAAAGQISGTVTGADTGAPLEGVDVHVVGLGLPAGSFRTETDADGHYSVTGLPIGRYTVQFSAFDAGYARIYYAGGLRATEDSIVEVTAGQATSGIDQALVRSGAVSGRLTESGSEGRGLPGRMFRVIGPGGSWEALDMTGEDGRYLTGGLVPGEYRIFFYPGEHNHMAGPGTDWFTVEAGEVTTGIDYSMPVGGKIEGRVTGSAGTTVYHFDVRVIRSDGSVFTTHSGVGSLDGGRYEVPRLPAGSYRLQFEARGFTPAHYGGATALAEATPLDVRLGETITGVDQVLEPAPPVDPPVGPPALVSPPVASGIAREGASLSVDPGTWTGGPVSLRHIWWRCPQGPWARCETIDGESSARYTPGPDDVGTYLRIIVVPSGPGGSGVPVFVEGGWVLPAMEPDRASESLGAAGSGSGHPTPPPAPGPGPIGPPLATVPAPPVPVGPAPPARLRLAAPSVSSLRVGERVRLTVATRVPVAAKGRPAVAQYRIGKRWVRAAGVRVPANGRLRVRLLVAVPAVRAGARVPARVRVHLPAHRGRPAVTGPARQFRLPAAPRVGAAR